MLTNVDTFVKGVIVSLLLIGVLASFFGCPGWEEEESVACLWPPCPGDGGSDETGPPPRGEPDITGHYTLEMATTSLDPECSEEDMSLIPTRLDFGYLKSAWSWGRAFHGDQCCAFVT